MAVAARPTPDDRIRAALWFADHGFGVFPVWSTDSTGKCRCPAGSSCNSPGKHPVTLNGFKDATQDPVRIRTLLSAGSEPNYGMLPPEGVFAWDLDGEGWSDRLAGLEATLGELPATLRTQTAHGEHRFFRWPASHPRPIGKAFGFVTRWGTGRDAGYVIGPRSVHQTGAEYAPVGDTYAITELPAPWAEAILTDLQVPADLITVGAGGYQLPDPGYTGSRYEAILRYIGSRYMRGIAREEIWAGVQAVLAPRFLEPLTEADLRGRFDRAWGRTAERFGPPLDIPDDSPEVEVPRQRTPQDELGLLDIPETAAFPPDPDPVAFDGLIGECIDDLLPGTDASRVGLLGCLVSFCGALIPGQAHWQTDHTSSPFIALVGDSGVGRKGTAIRRVQEAMAATFDRQVVQELILDGINSGEGLVHALAKRSPNAKGLIVEEEYASLLASRQREGSTLDPKMRVAFDGSQLSNRRANDQVIVPNPFWLPALIAITPTELQEKLERSAMTSGSANRWLYLPVLMRDVTSDNSPARFSPEHKRRLEWARRRAQDVPNPLEVDDDVNLRLIAYHKHLVAHTYGMAADLSKRLHVIAFRIALVHALVEGSVRVTMAHLRRALALTEYARSGIPWVFRAVVGNADADLLYRQLVHEGSLTRHAITQQLIRDAKRRQDAIDDLLRLKLAEIRRVITRGRGRDVLVPVVARGTFVHFVQGFATPQAATPENLHELHESDPEPARKLHESRTELHESPAPLHGSSVETVRCRSFNEHQTRHRWTGSEWVCDLCEGPL